VTAARLSASARQEVICLVRALAHGRLPDYPTRGFRSKDARVIWTAARDLRRADLPCSLLDVAQLLGMVQAPTTEPEGIFRQRDAENESGCGPKTAGDNCAAFEVRLVPDEDELPTAYQRPTNDETAVGGMDADVPVRPAEPDAV